MTLDHLLARVWRDNYRCYAHACETWQHITGESLAARMPIYHERGTATREDAANFQELNFPVSPCLVLMDQGINNETHLGIYYEDRIMHLRRTGAYYEPLVLATVGFRRVRFYK